MSKPQLYEFTADFDVDGIPNPIKVYHNLPDNFGMSIRDAFENWQFRTRKHTSKSFCKYVMGKDPAFVCMTEKQFNRLNGVAK